MWLSWLAKLSLSNRTAREETYRKGIDTTNGLKWNWNVGDIYGPLCCSSNMMIPSQRWFIVRKTTESENSNSFSLIFIRNHINFFKKLLNLHQSYTTCFLLQILWCVDFFIRFISKAYYDGTNEWINSH